MIFLCILFLEYMKTLWEKFCHIFGFNKNSKYVKEYLNQANMRSGVFMSAIIFILEVWLIIRQTDKYLIDQIGHHLADYKYGVFQVIFSYTSNFWLMMSFGAAMFAYCVFFKKKHHNFKRCLPIFITAGISFALCCLLPFEFIFASRAITGVTLALLLTLFQKGELNLTFEFNMLSNISLSELPLKGCWPHNNKYVIAPILHISHFSS